MSWFSKLLFAGIPIKEYCTVTVEDAIRERVYLKVGKGLKDISQNQWLLCLEPAVFGIWLDKTNTQLLDGIDSPVIFFAAGEIPAHRVRRNALAIAHLVEIDRIVEEDGTLYLFRVKRSHLYHINLLKIFLLHYKFYKKQTWPFNKYKSLVAAYSYPRKVRIISFKKESHFNIFPMDLLGAIPGTKRLVFGLRHTNVSLPGMIETGKMAASEVSFDHKETIYELGKHHTGGPAKLEDLPFQTLQTKQFGFYVPEWVTKYDELNILRHINLGSHMLLWTESINEVKLKKAEPGLYHIHFLHYLYQQKKDSTYQEV